MSNGLNPRRILGTALALALVAAAWVLAPLARDAYVDRRARQAAEPHPIPATDVEQAAIVRTLLASDDLGGLPFPPPPPAGQIAPPATRRLPLLLQETLVLRPCLQAVLCRGSYPDNPLGYLVSEDPELRDVDLKLRRELVLANAAGGMTPDPGVVGLARMPWKAVAVRLSGGRFWPSFHAAFPETNGYVSVTRAVVSPDRKRALVYTELSCGETCGTGALFQLAREPGGWKIERLLRIWQS
jgi:hypothetical protein